MSDWIEWHGGSRPVAGHVLVEVRCRAYEGYAGKLLQADQHDWQHVSGSRAFDIIAYRIVSQDSELDRQTKLFCDLKSDEEKANFFLMGRGYETGVIAKAIQNDVAMAYTRCAEGRKELDRLRAELEALKTDIATYVRISSEQASENETMRAENARLREALEAIDKECFSHIDGRDLFAQMHPRHTLDIKRRIDARETWYEGDWLSDLWIAIKKARAALQGAKDDPR